MAIRNLQTLKSWFRKYQFPTEIQFSDLFDSYWHKLEKIGIDGIDGLTESLNDFRANILNTVNELVVKAMKNLQLQRRIAIIMETSEMLVVIGEKQKITKVTAKNVSTLEIKPNNSAIINWEELPLDKDINVDISNCVDTDMLIRITRKTLDNISTLYFFTQVIE